MKDGSPRSSSAFWRSLLDLGERLLDSNSVVQQHSLIEEYLTDNTDSQVEVCLSEDVYRLPGTELLPIFASRGATGILRQALDTRQIQLNGSTTSKPTHIAIPLTSQDTLIGALELRRPPDYPFSNPEIDTFQKAAVYLAGLLYITHQVAIKNWRLEQLALLRSVSAQLVHVTDLDDLCARVTSLILRTLKYYYVAIFTVEPGQEWLRFRASAYSGFQQNGEPAPAPEIRLRIGEGMVGYAARSGEELLAPNVQGEPHYRYLDTLPETHSEFALPLKIEGRVLGVLDIQSDETDAFHEADQLVLKALADNIAVAMEGVRLYSNLAKRADQISTVAEIGRVITSILEEEQLLQQVVALLHGNFGYPYVHVFTVQPGRRKIIYQVGSGSRSQALAAAGLMYDMDDPVGILPWVAREGKLLVVNDVSREPRYRPTDLPPQDTRAELAVPFVFHGEVLGILDVQSDHIDAFDEDEVFLFEALADNVAVALHNALLYRSEKWRRQVAESFRDIAGLLSTNLGLDPMLDAILTELERNLPSVVAAIWLRGSEQPEEEKEETPPLQLAAIHGLEGDDVQRVRELHAEADEWLNQTLKSGQPLIRRPEDPFGPIGIALNYGQDYSAIAAPLLAGDRTLGLLVLVHPQDGRYGSEARGMVAAFASYAAVAIENSRLYASAQEQAWVSTVLLQVTEATQSLESLDELLNSVVRLAPMLVGVRGAAVFLWNSTTQVFHMAASYGINDAQKADFASRDINPGDAQAFDQIRVVREPVFVRDCREGLGIPDSIACDADAYSYTLLPITSRSEFMGAFLVEQLGQLDITEPEQALGTERLSILQGIVQQTSVAIENINLLENKQAEAYVTAVLLQVAQAVVGSGDLHDVLQTVVHLMPILVGIDFSAIYLLNADKNRYLLVVMYAGSTRLDEDIQRKEYAVGVYPLLDEVMATENLVVCPLGNPPPPPENWPLLPVSENPAERQEILKETEDLLMGFPLSVKGEQYGILLVRESNADPTFRERRVEIINGIAQQVSLAIQNDRLNIERIERERLEREFQLAREIQQTFLPSKLPSPTGWELDVQWRPARQVGGDFYDVFKLPHRRLGVVIADVSDKGMPAALYMTVTRTLIRATAQEEASPAKVLERVSSLLLMDSQNGMFVTCVYAIISLGSGEIVYANAGHNPPVILHSENGRVERLQKGGMAMAVLENTPQDDQLVRLHNGDTLLMYTDGITEAFSADGDMYGEQRLLEAMKCCPITSAKEIVKGVDASVMEFTQGAPASDDITLFAIRRKTRSKPDTAQQD